MTERPKSNLFYQTRLRRPALAQARGIYMWDVDGKRYLDGSSGAMVCNIGHSNPHVLEAMRRQMEKSTFGYRLHFETEPSERLATKAAALAPEGLSPAVPKPWKAPSNWPANTPSRSGRASATRSFRDTRVITAALLAHWLLQVMPR